MFINERTGLMDFLMTSVFIEHAWVLFFETLFSLGCHRSVLSWFSPCLSDLPPLKSFMRLLPLPTSEYLPVYNSRLPFLGLCSSQVTSLTLRFWLPATCWWLIIVQPLNSGPSPPNACWIPLWNAPQHPQLNIPTAERLKFHPTNCISSWFLSSSMQW